MICICSFKHSFYCECFLCNRNVDVDHVAPANRIKWCRPSICCCAMTDTTYDCVFRYRINSEWYRNSMSWFARSASVNEWLRILHDCMFVYMCVFVYVYNLFVYICVYIEFACLYYLLCCSVFDCYRLIFIQNSEHIVWTLFLRKIRFLFPFKLTCMQLRIQKFN